MKNRYLLLISFLVVLLFITFQCTIKPTLATDRDSLGWCCRDGDTFRTTQQECERNSGRFYENQRRARQSCEQIENGWCCNNGETFAATKQECERERGRFYENQRQARQSCEQQKTGWCCNNSETFMATKQECEKTRGRFYKNRRQAERNCEQQKNGWCCNNGETFAATKQECERNRGRFYKNQRQAAKICEQEKNGWCCEKDELFEATKSFCERHRGDFFENEKQATKACLSVPHVESLQPDTLVQGQTQKLTLIGSNLNRNMRIHFGTGVKVKPFRVSRLKNSATFEVDTDHKAKIGLRNVVLSFKGKKKQIARVTVVQGEPYPSIKADIKSLPKIEETLQLQPKKMKGSTFSSKQTPPPLPGNDDRALGSKHPDLTISVKTTNNIYHGDGKTLFVEIFNTSTVLSQHFTVGFCLSSQIKSKNKSKWLGTKKIQYLGPYNKILVPIPWQVQVVANPKNTFIAMVDIDDSVAENKTGEKNNQTKAFKYEIGPAVLPPTPIGKPVEGFQISHPCYQCSDGVTGETYDIKFGPTSSIKYNPKALALMSDYVNISLLRQDGSEMLTIAENGFFYKNNETNLWTWLIPSAIPDGKYTIYIESTDGHYFGESVPFTISTPISVSITKNPKTALGESPKAQKVSKQDNPPPGEKALKITNFKVKALKHKATILAGGVGTSFGAFARLSYVDIILEFEANKPFKFADSLDPTKSNLKAEAAWSLVVPKVTVAGAVMPLVDKQHSYPLTYLEDLATNTYYTVYDPSGGYPWVNSAPLLPYPKTIIPQGKSTITFRVDDPGVIHGVKLIGIMGQSGLNFGGYTCMQTSYPVFAVNVVLEHNIVPIIHTWPNEHKTSTKKLYAGKSHFINNPIVFTTYDTTKTSKQLGFVPPWSSPHRFYQKGYCEATGNVKGKVIW